MYLPIPVLIAAGAIVLALLAFALRRRGGGRDLIAPPRFDAPPPAPVQPPSRPWPSGAAPIGDLPAEVAAEVRALLAVDRKIEAIKVARAATGLSLADAKELVERMT